jgi:hypothetical protein
MQVPLSKAVTLKSPTVSAGYVDITFKVSLEVTAKLDLTGGSSQPPGDSTQTTITPLSYDSGALAESIAQSWMNKDGVRILGLNTAFTEVKLKGAMKVDKGFQVTVSGTGKLACGVELELEITLVKIENNWKSSGPKAAVKAKIPWFPFSVEPIKGVKISDVQMRPTVAFEFQPNYKKIAADVTEELGTDVAGEQVAAKAMRAAATAITFDAAVVGGILLAGVGTIGAAILTIAEGDEIAETAGETNALAQKLTDGFRIGAAGGSAPGDKAMMVGYTLGMENYNTANETIKSKNPDADPEAIKKAIADQVPAAVAKASPAIRTLAQDAVWDKYGSGHQDTWYHSYERDRWEAWSNIYGNDPRGDRRYVKYMNEHSDRKLGM